MRAASSLFGVWVFLLSCLLFAACGSEKDSKITPRVPPPFVPVTGNAQDKTIESDIYVGNSLNAIEIALPGTYDEKCAGANSIRWSLAEDVGTVTLADQAACRVTFSTSDKFQGGGKLIADLNHPDEGMIHFIMNLKMRNASDIEMRKIPTALASGEWHDHRDSADTLAWFSLAAAGTPANSPNNFLDIATSNTSANAACGNRNFSNFVVSPKSQRKFSIDLSASLDLADRNREDDLIDLSFSCKDTSTSGRFRDDFCPLKFQPITLANRKLSFEFKGRYFNPNNEADRNLIRTCTTVFTTTANDYFFLMDETDADYIKNRAATVQSELKIYLHIKHAHYSGEPVTPILLGTIFIR